MPSKFYLLVFFFFSSSFPISNSKLGRFSSSLQPHHTTTRRKIKGPKWKNRKNVTDTHTAAAERVLQFNMFCETLAGDGKMEMERHKGSGEMSIEN